MLSTKRESAQKWEKKKMKRKLTKVLAMILVISTVGAALISCSSKSSTYSSNEKSNKSNTASEDTSSYKKNTETTQAPEEEKKEVWEKSYYVDEFQQPTSEWFVSTTILDGTFSNSATTNSKLYVGVTIDASKLSFVLFEYGSSQVKNYHSKNASYSVSVRDSNGSTQNFTGDIPSGADRIIFTSSDSSSIINLMKAQDISVYIKENDTVTSTYLFSIPSGNLAEMLSGTEW